MAKKGQVAGLKRMLDRIYASYIRFRRGRLKHSLFGELNIIYCIPKIRMYWWQSTVHFAPAGHAVTLELHCAPTGPNRVQEDAYRSLLLEYPRLLKYGIRSGDIPPDVERLQLEKITLFIHGHIDLSFRDDEGKRTIYADSESQYLTPEVAMCN